MNANTMTIPELLLVLRDYDLKLSTSGKELVVRGRQEVLSPELLAQLQERKAELVEAVGQLERGSVIFRVKRPSPRSSLPRQAILYGEDE